MANTALVRESDGLIRLPRDLGPTSNGHAVTCDVVPIVLKRRLTDRQVDEQGPYSGPRLGGRDHVAVRAKEGVITRACVEVDTGHIGHVVR